MGTKISTLVLKIHLTNPVGRGKEFMKERSHEFSTSFGSGAVVKEGIVNVQHQEFLARPHLIQQLHLVLLHTLLYLIR